MEGNHLEKRLKVSSAIWHCFGMWVIQRVAKNMENAGKQIE